LCRSLATPEQINLVRVISSRTGLILSEKNAANI